MTATPDLSPLFQPFTCKSLSLRNRIVMSPMTRQFAPGGVLIDEVDGYYARRAAGGTGLIVSEGTAVDHAVAHYSAKIPHFYGDAALARWRAVAAAVHAEGGAIVPQLWHSGLARRRSHTANPELPNASASALTEDDLTAAAANGTAPPSDKPRRPAEPLSEAEIADVVAAFAQGAADAKAVGCDGVAIHGAHGYLLDQFFWERSNRRDDRYGGSLENRIRFAVEVVAAVRAAVGPDFAILLRFSQWKSQDYTAKIGPTPDALAAILQPLADAGVDVFDASTRRFWEPEFEGSPLNLAGWAKKLTGKAAMTVGSIGLDGEFLTGGGPAEASASTERLEQLAEMIARGDFDLAGVGRALIANPDWANLVESGRFDALRPYNASAHVKTLEQTEAA
ncbi:oxidoreductase [Sphingomonas immobilis]|uniref:12-oxophytodienoate reductase n=1 Tax=Sphingomonas immobilis TaxID=3063997 RepID=A0ABT8ZXI7_9SPHN|nr:12-oxophytodienoate reductase [Sphingomonas sp. CA1-15]MDO7842276.1 12-oxophytodienoate reductase [Sphingomonas sp. CA1-15]